MMRRNLLILMVVIGGVACKKNNKIYTDIVTSEKPEKSLLISPSKDNACYDLTQNSGVVFFKWNKSSNADKYNLIIKNLITQKVSAYQLVDTIYQTSLDKGQPYSWFVTSSSKFSKDTAQSETWKFYVPAEPTSNHLPSPAHLVFPTLGASFTDISKIDIKWDFANDLDNDIVSYELYLGKNKNPEILNLNVPYDSNSISVTLNGSSVYYWRLVTKDSRGNKASTDIFSFTLY